MPQILKATYHNGTFILQVACDFPEGVEVELFVKSPQVIPPKITDIKARQDFLRLLVKRMQQNPIPASSPRFRSRPKLTSDF